MSKADEYAKALDDLEARRRDGKVTEGEYQVWKKRLLDESNAKPSALGTLHTGCAVVALVIVAIIVIAFVASLF